MLPPGLIINELPMGGMTREQALEAIDQAYTRPITVYYASKLTPLLLPEMVELILYIIKRMSCGQQAVMNQEVILLVYLTRQPFILLMKMAISYKVLVMTGICLKNQSGLAM